MGLDLLGHHRLGVGRFVGLVVAVPAVADHVDDDVALPLAAVGHCQPDCLGAGLDIIGIDVDDRDVEPLRHVGGVRGRPGLGRIGREADLVVGDDVDRAPDGVAVEAEQVEGLGDHSLSGEGGVPVDQDRNGP